MIVLMSHFELAPLMKKRKYEFITKHLMLFILPTNKNILSNLTSIEKKYYEKHLIFYLVFLPK